MHVLITRPKADAETLRSRIEELGCSTTLAPLVAIVPNAIPLSAIEGATALIATSRNALKALAGSPALGLAKSLPLYVVGPGTAATAREMGFTDVVEGAGTAADLATMLSAQDRSDGCTFAYLRGDVLAFDLEAALKRAEVNVVSVAAYRSVAEETLSPNVAAALARGEIDAVTLMSPRTAERWARLAGGIITSAGRPIAHLCLSEAVAKSLLSRFGADNVLIAAHPKLEEMLALVKRLAAHSGAE
jgi:uroporphyrinogen-III synthase